jgi:hypothetical protein
MNFETIPIVAIALSIVISWSLYALFCSFLHEAIVQIKAERGRYMKKYLFKQLYDQPNGVNWASMLYMHGTVDLLTRKANKPTSDINPRIFAETLIEVVARAQITQMARHQMMQEEPGPKVRMQLSGQLNYEHELLNDFKAATLLLQQSDVVNFFRQAMASAELITADVQGSRDSAVYRNLVQQVEQWYSEMMSRLSLWYRKKTKRNLFFLGSLLAFILNVDSIQLLEHFTKDPAARRVMIQYYEANTAQLHRLSAMASTDSTQVYAQRIKLLKSEMDSLATAAQLPVGFRYNVFSAKSDNRNILMVLLGCLFSGFAASAGAPFWFDLLKKAYSVKPGKN